MHAPNAAFRAMTMGNLTSIRDTLDYTRRTGNTQNEVNYVYVAEKLLELVNELEAAYQEVTGWEYRQHILPFSRHHHEILVEHTAYRRTAYVAALSKAVAG